jgi:hypothetical protein
MINFELEGQRFSYPDFPQAELVDGWNEDAEELNELDGLADDIDEEISHWADWLVKAAFDPAAYAEWEADPYENGSPDGPEPPVVTALRV